MIQLELCQQHMLLAPACGVLLLPSDKTEVAAELHARGASTAAGRKVMSTVTIMEYACSLRIELKNRRIALMESDGVRLHCAI